MLEAIDYSSHRGGMVVMIPKIHALLKENAEKDTLAAFKNPENIILWRQAFNKRLVDINRRFVLITDGASVAGILFYRFDGGSVYIDELQAAWQYRNNPAVIATLLDKFVNNREVRACEKFFAGENVKSPVSKEILASVGFKETFPGGWEPLGSLTEAAGELKLRYGHQ